MSSDSTTLDSTAVLTPPRIFRYNGQTIIDRDQDPGPEFTPQMILDHIKTTGIYPELSSAKIEIRQSTLTDGTVQIEFVKSGTKGKGAEKTEVEQIKQKEVFYLICFLAQAKQKPTVPRAQTVLRDAIGLWSITTDDIVTYWPQSTKVAQ